MGRRGRLVALLTVVALLLVTFGSSPASHIPGLPDLPAPDLSGFAPAVRQQMTDAYKFARVHPRDDAMAGQLGMVLHAYKQYQLAETCYARAHRLSSGSFEWAYYLAVVQQALGKYGDAIANLRQAIRINAEYGPARLRMADLLLAAGSIEEARALYEQILSEDPGLAIAHYGLGRSLAAQGNLAQAAEHLSKACELVPAFAAAHYALALAYRDMGRLTEAREHLLLYQKQPDGAPPPSDLLLADLGKFNAGGLIAIRKAEYLAASGRLDAAALEMERAIQIDPNDEAAHASLIGLYWRLGRPDKSDEHYRAALRINPNSARSHFSFGMVLSDQGKLPQAAEAFRRCLSINPLDSRAHAQLGRVLERLGSTPEAIREYELALQTAPNSRETHYLMGLALLKTRRKREAIEHLGRTLAPEDEKTPGYLLALARACAGAGNRQKASQYFARARQQALSFEQVELAAQIESESLQAESSSRGASKR